MAPERGAVTLWDGALKHFGVRVSQGGTKSFIVLLGSGHRQAIGRYPTISIAQARAKAKTILAERTLSKHTTSMTWDTALAQFLDHTERNNRPRTHYEYSRSLNKYFNFRTLRLGELTKADITRKLDRLNHIPIQQLHSLVHLKTFLRWTVTRGYIDRNPADGLVANRAKSRTRVLTDAELKSIWEASVDLGNFGTIVKLLILTGQRRGEIAALKTEFISTGAITLPKELCKNGREHTFPIGSFTALVIANEIELHPSENGLIFPARGKHTPFNGWAKSKLQLDQKSGVADWTLHDIRRTFATNMAALGVPLHVLEKLLNHVSGTISSVAAVYNRHQFMDEMRAAVDRWEARLRAIVQA